MIKINNLQKRFGDFTAVDDISFQVQQGEVLGFLGPNGAGKSTTMKMLTGFLAPTNGSASICDFDITDDPISAKKAIGYLPEGAPAYAEMTVKAFLEFIADVRGLQGEEKSKAVFQAIEKTNLAEVMEKTIDTLSKGFKRRVGLAQAILHDPPVLIMDEPTDGLDPNQKHEVRELIKAMSKDKAIIISTHILEEVEAICSRAIIIARGKILFDGTPEQLQARASDHNAVKVSFNAANAPADFETVLKQQANVGQISVESDAQGRHFLICSKDGSSIVKQVNDIISGKHWVIDELYAVKGHLDTVFRDLTNAGSEEART